MNGSSPVAVARAGPFRRARRESSRKRDSLMTGGLYHAAGDGDQIGRADPTKLL
jgi:hypothetical protein